MEYSNRERSELTCGLFHFNSGAGVIAILANSTVMLAQLEMTCIQFVFKKVVPVAHATISPQVEGLNIFRFALHLFAS
jgi:hypothetical protein